MLCLRCHEEIAVDDTIEHYEKHCHPKGLTPIVCCSEDKLEPKSATYCGCDKCLQRKDGLFYSVKPYKWSVGSHHSGLSYQIIENRMIATAKCELDANKIAWALNAQKTHERRERTLKDQLHHEMSKPKTGISLDDIRLAFIAEASVHCRWSVARKNVKDFYDAVLVRLRSGTC